MNSEKIMLDNLIKTLVKENSHHHFSSIAPNKADYFRALCNVRPPSSVAFKEDITMIINKCTY